MKPREDRYVVTGFSCSVVAHAVLLALFLYSTAVAPDFPENQIVYSITLEGGKQLGGVAQVPDKDQPKTPPAPPKKVAAPEKVEVKEEKPEAKEEKKIEEKKVDSPPEDRIELPKEVEKKPTPRPTPKVTATPKKTAAPTPPKAPSLAEINKQLQQATQRYLGESTDAGGRGFGAAKLGGTKMGGGVVRPPEFFTYQQLLKQHVKGGWTWFDTSAELVSQVTFSISERGEISNVQLAKSSGNAGFDESVLRAVKKASPVPAPPATVYQFFRDVRMTFDPRE